MHFGSQVEPSLPSTSLMRTHVAIDGTKLEARKSIQVSDVTTACCPPATREIDPFFLHHTLDEPKGMREKGRKKRR